MSSCQGRNVSRNIRNRPIWPLDMAAARPWTVLLSSEVLSSEVLSNEVLSSELLRSEVLSSEVLSNEVQCSVGAPWCEGNKSDHHILIPYITLHWTALEHFLYRSLPNPKHPPNQTKPGEGHASAWRLACLKSRLIWIFPMYTSKFRTISRFIKKIS